MLFDIIDMFYINIMMTKINNAIRKPLQAYGSIENYFHMKAMLFIHYT